MRNLIMLLMLSLFLSGYGQGQINRPSVPSKTKQTQVNKKRAKTNKSINKQGRTDIIKTDPDTTYSKEDIQTPVKEIESADGTLTSLEMYQRGEEFENRKNYGESMKWYIKAAEAGDMYAQRKLGYRYMTRMPSYVNAINLDNNILWPPSEDEAKKWFLKAAEQGDAESQRELGKMSWASERMSWFEKAAKQGDNEALYELARYKEGGYNRKKDIDGAIKLYFQSAEQGYVKAQKRLGEMYFNGGEGVTQNYKLAFKWYQEAAQSGDIEAQVKLGYMYYVGVGVDKNKDEAQFLWEKAAAQNNQVAKEYLDMYIKK